MRPFILLMTLLPVMACKKNSADTGNNQPVAAVTQLNQHYGPDPKQVMDIYLPAGRSADSTKLIFLIHGGGWTEGDKADFVPFITTLQSKLPRYAFVNINYRLAANGQNIFPTQENDVQLAVEFLQAKRTEYKISGSWVFMGASAGGHLAMLQGYKYSSPIKAKAVISFFGPSDLTALYNSNPLLALQLAALLGGTPSSRPAIYQQSSPVNYITAASPPTMLLQGGADPLVPPSQSVLVKDKLASLGVVSQYVFYPNNGHGWTGTDLLDSFEKITAFLQLNVH